MVQNRNKLMELFIGNISNAIVHEILGKAIDDDNIRNHYNIELKISVDKARSYREKINPVNKVIVLPAAVSIKLVRLLSSLCAIKIGGEAAL